MTLNRTALSDHYTMKAAAEFARTQLGLGTAAVIYDDGAYGRGLGEGFMEAFEQGGGTVTNLEMRPAGQTEFGDILARITPNNPQLIFYGGAYLQAAGLVAEKNTVGLQDTAFMSGDGIFFPDFIAIGDADAEGSYAVIASAASGECWNTFLQKYESAGGRRDAVAFGPNAYDAVGILAQAIKSVATLNSAGHLEIGRQALANAVRATQGYAGLTGDITFDANGDRLSGAVTIYQVQQGQWAPVYSDGP
jgi:branched-chain amino acid transport system substrate-binding protein